MVTTDAASPVNTTLTANGPSGADNIPAYTSRGPRRNDSALKPDITAPAEVVNTAANGTGTGTEFFNGTSSATPHVAGAMALMKQVHPTWTVEQLKALVMDTADQDLYTAPNETGPKFGIGRIGAGRMDLATAARANVVAYTAATPLGVNVSFGAVDVPVTTAGTFSRPQTVNVVNQDPGRRGAALAGRGHRLRRAHAQRRLAGPAPDGPCRPAADLRPPGRHPDQPGSARHQRQRFPRRDGHRRRHRVRLPDGHRLAG